MEDKLKIEAVSGSEYKISVAVPAEEVDKKFIEFFESIKNKTEIPGFRKGKAPIEVVRKYLGEKARSPVSQVLVHEYYTKALQEGGIAPIGPPKFVDHDSSAKYLGKFGFDNSFSISFILETLPKIDVVGYKDMEVKLPEQNMQELYDMKLNEYREKFATHAQISDRGAKFGDTINIDFVGSVDGVPFNGGSANGYSVENLGSGNFVPGFEQQIVGINTGETKVIDIKFPDKYREKNLAGREAKFNIKINSIIEKKLAEVDNDLAMMSGFNSLEEFSESVKQFALTEKMARDRHFADRIISAKLIELNSFEAPKTMVANEKKNLMSRFKMEELPETTKQEIGKQAETKAVYNVKRAILMDAIYNKEKDIEVRPDELDAMLEEHAKASGKTKDNLVSDLNNSGQMDNFMGVLRVGKVIDFIINQKKEGV